MHVNSISNYIDQTTIYIYIHIFQISTRINETNEEKARMSSRINFTFGRGRRRGRGGDNVRTNGSDGGGEEEEGGDHKHNCKRKLVHFHFVGLIMEVILRVTFVCWNL